MDQQQKKRLIWQLPFLALLIVGTILIIRQQRNPSYQHNTGAIFGTTYSITYQYADDLHEEIQARLQKVDMALSMFNENSIISKINRGERTIPENLEGNMFVEVYELAEQISEDTNGAFDITVAPLVNAWGFGFKHEQMPTKRQVDSLRQIIGYQKVALKNGKVEKQDPRMMLDCSAIAKGFGVDAVARMLRDRGVQNFMVEIGGEVVTCGVNAQRLPWRVGVIKPSEDSLSVGHELQTILNVTDKALATSGNYRNFYYKNGRRYAHTIDPQTGYPVQHSLLSATVLANSCTVADAYATSFMVMGLERAQQLLERHSELMAYLIYDDGHGDIAVWFSPSLRNKIEE